MPHMTSSISCSPASLQEPELKGHGGAAAHTGPGREGPALWPPHCTEGMSHSPAFAPFDLPFAFHSLLFAPHSPGFTPSEGEKKCCELHLERREGEGMSHSPDFAPSELPFASHSPEIARLEELFAPSEEEGTRPELGGMRSARPFTSCTSELARQKLRGMPRELWGMDRDEEPC